MSNSKRKSLAAELGKLRSIKSEAEQKIMRQAADISGRAHAKVRELGDLWDLFLSKDSTRPCDLLRQGSRSPPSLPTSSTSVRYKVHNDLLMSR